MLRKHWFTFLSIAFLPNPGGTSPSITGTTCPNWQILTIRKYCIEAFYQAYYWKIRRSWKPETIERLCGVCGCVCVCARAHGSTSIRTHLFTFSDTESLSMCGTDSLRSLLLTWYSRRHKHQMSVLGNFQADCLGRQAGLRRLETEYQSYARTQTPLGAGWIVEVHHKQTVTWAMTQQLLKIQPWIKGWSEQAQDGWQNLQFSSDRDIQEALWVWLPRHNCCKSEQREVRPNRSAWLMTRASCL